MNAKGGRFITSEPKIRQWDRIYIEITPQTGDVIKDVFHVRIREKNRTQGMTEQYVLHCPHQSSNLWSRTIGLPSRRASGYETLNTLVEHLNANRGDRDPEIVVPAWDPDRKLGNRFDPNTHNDYIFEGVTFQQAVDELIQIELNPPEGGGSFEAMYVRFVSAYDHATGNNLDKVYLQAIEQGYRRNNNNFNNIANITLEYKPLSDATRPNILAFRSDLEVEKGTNLIAIGDRNSGSYPTDLSKWSGAKDVFESAKVWREFVGYRQGTLARLGDKTYECIVPNISGIGNKPPNTSYWIERTFLMPSFWRSGNAYAEHALVVYGGVAFECLEAHTSTNNITPDDDTKWRRVSFVPTTHYSPLTKQKAQYWINMLGGAKHATTDNKACCMIDPTVIIKDKNHPRTWVHCVASSPADIPSALKIGTEIPDRFRVLVIDTDETNFHSDGRANWTGTDTGTGDFSGSDKYGVSYAGNIAQYRDGEWIVKQICNDDQEIYDWYNGWPWVKNPHIGAFIERDGTPHDGARATTWKMGSYLIAESADIQGVVNLIVNHVNALGTNIANAFFGATYDEPTTEPPVIGAQFVEWVDATAFQCMHPVAFDSTRGRVKVENTSILGADEDGNSAVSIKANPYNESGLPNNGSAYVGFNFCPMWPPSSQSAPYGSVSVGEQISLPVMDFNNLHKTHRNEVSWFGPDSEDYFPIQGISYWEKFIRRDITWLNQPPLDGDYKMGIWLADDDDNVVILDYTHQRNNETQPVDANIGSKRYFVAVAGNSQFLSAFEPEVLNVFDDRTWVRGGIFTRDSLDDQGRYKSVLNSKVGGTSTELQLIIDSFRFTKPLVATTSDRPSDLPDRNIETQKIRADKVSNYAQLKNYVLGLERLYNFDRDEYIIPTRGRGDLAFGDPVYIKDPLLLDETTDSRTNTIKAVVDKIIYTISKPKRGPGGFKRTVHAVTRVWP